MNFLNLNVYRKCNEVLMCRFFRLSFVVFRCLSTHQNRDCEVVEKRLMIESPRLVICANGKKLNMKKVMKP